MRWAGCASFVAVLGCAGGAEPNVGPLTGGVGSASQSSTNPTASQGSDSDAETSSGSSEGESLEDGSSSEGDPSTTMPPDPTDAEGSSSGGDDGPPPVDCPNQTTCATAEVVGMVSGDESSPVINRVGTTSTWLTFQVTEDNDAVTGENLSVTITLTSPPTVDFDLYAYRGAANGPTGCNGAMESSTSSSATDLVHMSWGEGGLANGGDDRSWIAVEIVPKAPMCDDGSQWSLEIDGDS